MQSVIDLIHSTFYKKDLPEFGAGDTVNVHFKIIEGNKERIQQYQGTVIQRRGKGGTEMVTVRKMSNGVGVERVFPIHSPFVEKVEVVKKGKVRRARIYYMRGRSGKSARIKEQAQVPTDKGAKVATPKVATVSP